MEQKNPEWYDQEVAALDLELKEGMITKDEYGETIARLDEEKKEWLLNEKSEPQEDWQMLQEL